MMPVRLAAAMTVACLPFARAQQPTAPTATPAASEAPKRSVADALALGLAWLIAHQDEDGHWSAAQFVRHDPKGDLGTGVGKPDQDFHVTAWALGALLATGNSERLGPHRDVVQRASAWLLAQQQADGFLGEPRAPNSIAAHAIACSLLLECAGLSDRKPAAAPLQRLLQLRLPDGTWPARPGDTASDANATYQAAVACVEGGQFLRVQTDLEPVLTAFADGRFPTVAPAAEGFLRVFARHSRVGDERLDRLCRELSAQPPQWPTTPERTARTDFLGWQLGSSLLYQIGDDAARWHESLLTTLVAHQRTDGTHAGSWDPIDVRGVDGGRVYATAVNLQSLALARRMLQLTARRAGGGAPRPQAQPQQGNGK